MKGLNRVNSFFKPSLICVALVATLKSTSDALPVNPAVHESNPLVSPRAQSVFDESEIAPYIKAAPGPTKGSSSDRMFNQKFLDYFAAQPKSNDVPFKKLMEIVAEVCAEAKSGNHRFSIYEVKDGCFLRNVLFKSKLAEHGIDISKSTASLISRHGWFGGTRNGDYQAQINKLLHEKDELLRTNKSSVSRVSSKRSKEEELQSQSRVKAIDRELEKIEAESKKSVPRWTYHSVCVIQTDKGPIVFDPDVKSQDQRFECDLTSKFDDWMRYSWGNYDPHFILAPYNYTDLYQFNSIPISATPHAYSDKTYGHLFNKLPDDPIWKSDPNPPQLLEKNSEGGTQPYVAEISWKVAAMRPLAIASEAKYGNRQCEDLKARSDQRRDCFQNNYRKYCNNVYEYESNGETDQDELTRAKSWRDKCIAKIQKIDRTF